MPTLLRSSMPVTSIPSHHQGEASRTGNAAGPRDDVTPLGAHRRIGNRHHPRDSNGWAFLELPGRGCQNRGRNSSRIMLSSPPSRVAQLPVHEGFPLALLQGSRDVVDGLPAVGYEDLREGVAPPLCLAKLPG